MVDARFYTSAGERTISSLLAAVGRANLWIGGDAMDRLVSGVSELDTARESDLAFASSADFSEALGLTAAGVVLHAAALGEQVPLTATRIACDTAQIVFSEICGELYPAAIQAWATGQGPAPLLEDGVKIAPNVTLGTGVEIGAGSVIGPNSTIGPGVSIGRNCTIGANCSVEYAQLGDGVVLLPGARVGTSGFGYLPFEGRLVPVPQLGRAILQDRVEVGGNSVIDRGALGDTVIGEGTKIGNLVNVAHNCKIGRNCMLTGLIVLAGSVTFEDNVVCGVNAVVVDHVRLGAGCRVQAGTTVTKGFPAGTTIGGPLPSRRVRDHQARMATLMHLSRKTQN
jgi:UDP-3-O-[3-hydroxymyristoyl] glucosamine N-acyltransferase